jgi:hypothetical protein
MIYTPFSMGPHIRSPIPEIPGNSGKVSPDGTIGEFGPEKVRKISGIYPRYPKIGIVK